MLTWCEGVYYGAIAVDTGDSRPNNTKKRERRERHGTSVLEIQSMGVASIRQRARVLVLSTHPSLQTWAPAIADKGLWSSNMDLAG